MLCRVERSLLRRGKLDVVCAYITMCALYDQRRTLSGAMSCYVQTGCFDEMSI